MRPLQSHKHLCEAGGHRLRRPPVRRTTTPSMLCGPAATASEPRAENYNSHLAPRLPPLFYWLAGANPLPRRGRGASPVSTTTGEPTRWRRPVLRGDGVVVECERTGSAVPSTSSLLITAHGGGRGEAGRGRPQRAASPFSWAPAAPVPGDPRGAAPGRAKPAAATAQPASPRGQEGGR